MGSVVIDTHCHVHVSLIGDAKPVETGCCDGSKTAACTISSEGNNRRQTRDELAAKSDDDSCGASSVSLPPPDVVHITMGIKEDDWFGAVRFAAAHHLAADNLRRKSDAGRTHEPFQLETEDAINSSPASIPPYFQFGLGLHPWNAHARSQGWLRNLTALLEEHPQALVGEIGLDKVARTPETRLVEWDHQLEVFRVQMALAAELNRPVSVHCVKAYGKIVDFLRDADQDRPTTSSGRRGGRTGNGEARSSIDESGGGASGDVGGLQGCRAKVDGGGGSGGEPMECEAGRSLGSGRKLKRHSGTTERRKAHRVLPPRIALHSFTGSVEVAHDITRLGKAGGGGVEVYFGFSAAVNMRGDREAKRLIDVLSVVPDSRILIETDRQVPVAAADELTRVCGAIAEARGISVAEALALANRNAAQFLAEVVMSDGERRTKSES